MNKYLVKVEETRSVWATIFANTEEEALKYAEDGYKDGEIDMDEADDREHSCSIDND